MLTYVIKCNLLISSMLTECPLYDRHCTRPWYYKIRKDRKLFITSLQKQIKQSITIQKAEHSLTMIEISIGVMETHTEHTKAVLEGSRGALQGR